MPSDSPFLHYVLKPGEPHPAIAFLHKCIPHFKFVFVISSFGQVYESEFSSRINSIPKLLLRKVNLRAKRSNLLIFTKIIINLNTVDWQLYSNTPLLLHKFPNCNLIIRKIHFGEVQSVIQIISIYDFTI